MTTTTDERKSLVRQLRAKHAKPVIAIAGLHHVMNVLLEKFGAYNCTDVERHMKTLDLCIQAYLREQGLQHSKVQAAVRDLKASATTWEYLDKLPD